ncbi:MAG: hypothetical protein PVS2B2_01490 [Candidatus Acidiferrum sp.]
MQDWNERNAGRSGRNNGNCGGTDRAKMSARLAGGQIGAKMELRDQEDDREQQDNKTKSG